ncbi:hypothetical protein BJX70DRAFT_385993 [Aspergillus crustosus]
MAKLPLELVLHVVEYVIPSNPPLVFVANHVVTHTLLSLMLVCKLVSQAARKLLIKHCLQIDSAHRLMLFLQQGIVAADADNLPHWFSPNGLFLSPVPKEEFNASNTVSQVNDLSNIISGRLTRLIINMSLDDLYDEHTLDKSCRILRQAFTRMTQLEEFCCVKDEFCLDIQKGKIVPAFWSCWPRLRRLALYDIAMGSSQFIEGLRKCQNLTHLVLVRPDGLSEHVSPEPFDQDFLPRLQRLTIVDTECGFMVGTEFCQSMHEDKTFVGRLRALRSPQAPNEEAEREGYRSVDCYYFLRIPHGKNEDDEEIFQDWLLDHAMTGKVWEVSENQGSICWSSRRSNNLYATYTCDTCSAVFQRLDHFKRHTATHRTDKPFICDFCGSVYKRGLGGKEKHACDGCARLKRSCSGGQPCSECQSRGRVCSYERLRHRERNRAGSPTGEWREITGNTGHVENLEQLQPGSEDVERPAEPTRSTWDLGPMNFYASAEVCYKAYSRLP